MGECCFRRVRSVLFCISLTPGGVFDIVEHGLLSYLINFKLSTLIIANI